MIPSAGSTSRPPRTSKPEGHSSCRPRRPSGRPWGSGSGKDLGHLKLHLIRPHCGESLGHQHPFSGFLHEVHHRGGFVSGRGQTPIEFSAAQSSSYSSRSGRVSPGMATANPSCQSLDQGPRGPPSHVPPWCLAVATFFSYQKGASRLPSVATNEYC